MDSQKGHLDCERERFGRDRGNVRWLQLKGNASLDEQYAQASMMWGYATRTTSKHRVERVLISRACPCYTEGFTPESARKVLGAHTTGAHSTVRIQP
jgi:hypothetical protein